MTALVPPLDEGACQVWWAGPADAGPGLEAVLAADERERRGRFRGAADRDRFTTGYALARLVLAGHLGAPPASLRFERTCTHCGGPHGKPRLAGDGPLRFSLSHSGDRVAVAVLRVADGSRADVGVDVEEATRRVEVDMLVRSVLSGGEADTLAGLSADEQVAAFFVYWTRKEAVLKATGAGLRVPMTHLTLSPPAAPPRLLAWSGQRAATGRFRLYDLAPGPGHVGALATVDAGPLDPVEINGAALLKNNS